MPALSSGSHGCPVTTCSSHRVGDAHSEPRVLSGPAHGALGAVTQSLSAEACGPDGRSSCHTTWQAAAHVQTPRVSLQANDTHMDDA